MIRSNLGHVARYDWNFRQGFTRSFSLRCGCKCRHVGVDGGLSFRCGFDGGGRKRGLCSASNISSPREDGIVPSSDDDFALFDLVLGRVMRGVSGLLGDVNDIFAFVEVSVSVFVAVVMRMAAFGRATLRVLGRA